jgi:hypothetical protein
MEKDKYQIELEEKTKTLKECQENKSLKSCMNCTELFECKIREDYVKATYNSMSKGETGGFEF